MNSLKSIVVAMVAGATFAVSLPAIAGDDATIQTNTSTNVITGNKNTVRSTNTQTITNARNGRGAGTGDSGTVQSNDSYNDVSGNRNRVDSSNTQESTNVRNSDGTVRIRRSR